MLCGLIRLQNPLAKFGKYNRDICFSAEDVARRSLKVVMKEQSACLFCGLDGSGKARGHRSQ
jgi:hypothetical protein